MIRNSLPYLVSILLHLVFVFSYCAVHKPGTIQPAETTPVMIDFSINSEKEIITEKQVIKTQSAYKVNDNPQPIPAVTQSELPATSGPDLVVPDTAQEVDSLKLEYTESVPPQQSDSSNSLINDQSVTKYIKEEFMYIREIIVSNINYPVRAQLHHEEGTLLVSFFILQDGSVSNIKVVKSSGFIILDNNAIRTIEKSAPFPKPPCVAELKIPVTYSLFLVKTNNTIY
jgi:TonB family protein